MTDFSGDNHNTDYDIYGQHRHLSDTLGSPANPTLASSPFYLPNVIAAIVASVGIVVGCVGPWKMFGAVATGGLYTPTWGRVSLVLGAISAIALFFQLNWSRTPSTLRWAVPLSWMILVAGVSCLAIALVEIVNIRSMGDQFRSSAQIGWGLWLMAICSVVLCLTTPIAATQVSRASAAQAPIHGDRWTGAWRWAAIGASALVMAIAVYNGYKPTKLTIATEETTTVVVSPGATNQESLPANAKQCQSIFFDSEFRSSAAGTTMTTCPFAEQVRRAYLGQAIRNSVVTVYASSPVTGSTYTMSCTGSRVVTCAGGNDAIVYLY